jgi:hypothetical protein
MTVEINPNTVQTDDDRQKIKWIYLKYIHSLKKYTFP